MTEIARRRSLYGFEMNANDPDLRRREETRKTYNIKQLWQRTHEILRLGLLGLKSTDIANMLGISTVTVSGTLNSDLGMQKLSGMRRERDEEAIDVSKGVAKLYQKAIDTYENLLDDDKAPKTLKKETADTILMEIGGHRSPTKVEGKFAHGHLVRSEVDEIKRRGVAAAESSGMLAHEANPPIDITSKEVLRKG